MKTKLICFFALIVVFAGCDKIKNSATIPISTELKANIPVVVLSQGKKSFDKAGVVNAYVFNKTQDLSLAGNVDIEPYISRIKEVGLNSLVVTITGLSDGQIINSVSLDVTGVGNIFTQTNITMSNNSFTPVIAAATLDLVAAKLTADRKITLTVSGTASGAMSFTVGLNFDAIIIAYLL